MCACWEMFDVCAATWLPSGAKLEVDSKKKLTWAAVQAVEVVCRPNDVSFGRNAGSLQRCCGGSLGFWTSWRGAPVRVDKRSQLLPEIVQDCSYVGRRLSLRDWAIIRGNEFVFASHFLETGCIWSFWVV